jgi:deoxyadenosine/deoxycytidine kinase
MKILSHHLQYNFMGHCARRHRNAVLSSGLAILGRSIYEDGYVFAPALHEMAHILGRYFRTYERVFELLASSLGFPSLMGLLVPIRACRIILAFDQICLSVPSYHGDTDFHETSQTR